MSRDSSGTFTSLSNSWNAAVEGTTIDEGDWNEWRADVEAELTDSLSRSGKGKITAHIDFDENGSPGTPASNVGRLYAGDVGGITSLFYKDSADTVHDLTLPGDGVPYTFNSSTTTTSDPGANKIAFNHATFASITEIAIDDLDAHGADISAWIATWDDEGTSNRGNLILRNRANGGDVAIFRISGASTDETGWTRLAVTPITQAGTFSDLDPLFVHYGSPGAQGATGATGDAGAAGADGADGTNGADGADGTDPGLLYTFSTTTTDADPGAGVLRANNANLGSATALYIDDSDRNGNNHEATILGWDDVSNATLRGQLLISTPSDGAQVVYNITGASTDNSGYVALAVTYSSGATSFADAAPISVQFIPSGNDGAGAVDSVFGRTGAVAAANSDYDITQIDFSATDRIAGRVTAGAGLAEELTAAQVRTLLNVADGATANAGDLLASNNLSDVANAGTARTNLGLAIGSDVQAYDADTLKADVDDTLAAGFDTTADDDGTQSSGTYTPAAAGGNIKTIVNGGAFTIAPPTNAGTIIVQMTNNGSAGSVTTSGFSVVSGDDLTTTDTHWFLLYITKTVARSHLHIVAGQ